MFIIDKSHTVKTKRLDYLNWEMKQCRPELRLALVCMSGTLLSSDPSNIVAPLEILSSPSWDSPSHPLHGLCVKISKRPVSPFLRSPDCCTVCLSAEPTTQCSDTSYLNASERLYKRHPSYITYTIYTCLSLRLSFVTVSILLKVRGENTWRQTRRSLVF